MSRSFSSLLCALTFLSAASALADKPPVYALTGGRVVTVSGSVQDGATVVLRDGVIEAVGPGVKVPPEARVIDAKGLTITPGLIDAFGGVGLPAPTPARGGGGGGPAPAAPRDNPLAPQSMVLDKIRPGDALKARDSGFTTALVVPAAGVLPGRSVLLSLAGETAEQMAWRQPAALHLHMSTLVRQYPGSLMGTVAYARQALYDARRYRELWAAYEKSPAGKKRPVYDPALAAWDDVIAGRIPLIVTATRANDLRRALALGDEFKVKVVAAGAGQAAPLADLVKSRKLPLLVSVNFDPPKAGGFFGGNDDDEKARWEIAEAERAPAALHQAGVPFALVSGHAPNALAGVRKAIERGLPREAALRALTLSAAEALGIADRTGSLDAGKAANVTVWSGEPLTKDARVRMVFVDGTLYEPDPPAPGKGEDGKKDDQAADKPDAKVAVAPWQPPPVPARDASFAIMGATLLTAGPQGTIEKGTILVKDGKIAAIGANVELPSGLPVVNATGQFVTPGLIDAHSHTAIEGSVNECTDSVTAEVRIADVIDDHSIDIYRELAGGVTAINVLHGSCNAIGGQNAVLKMRWGKAPAELVFKEAPRGIKFALGENPKRANFSVPGQKRYPGTRMGVEIVIRKAFEDAKAYRREWEEYDKRLKAAGPKGEKPVAPPQGPAAGDAARRAGRQGAGARALLPVGRDPDADQGGRGHGLQDPHLPARAGGLQGGGRDREARRGRLHLLRLVDVQDGGARRHPVQRGGDGHEGGRGVAELRLGRAGAAALLGGREGREVRRRQRGGGAQDGHRQPGLAARDRQVRGHARGGQGRGHRDLQRPPVLARRAGGDDARGGSRGVRSRARPGRTAGRSGGGEPVKGAAILLSLLAATGAANAQEKSLVIQNARVVTVEGPTLERGTVVVTGGRIAAVGADVTAPAGAAVIDAAGRTLYPGLVDGLTTLGLTEIGSVAGSVDTNEVGDVNPHAKAWVAVHPHSELLPVARANGLTTALAAPAGGLLSGQSALIRLAGDTPEALVLKAPAAMHAVYPSGQPPFDISRLLDEPELKTLDERLKEKRKNQEKELRRLGDLLEEAKAYGAGVLAAKGAPVVPDLPMQALAPVARGELPLVMRADDEEDIRGSVAFASGHG
jgi:imidazolonepropionase-like amidohydrolase